MTGFSEPLPLPDGEVTFMFTDVEGSTRTWEAHPEEMTAALARHDQLVAESVAEYDGLLVRSRGEGDSFFAVFVEPVAAVASAASLQLRLAEEEWPAKAPIRVRVGLHHGAADLRGGSYYGQAVNRCARLRGVAHGGQVLLSQATVALVEAELPPGTGLRDLGLHRLRDLRNRERVYQLDIDGLPTNFPELRSLEAMPHNLPIQLTSFVGRASEMAELRRRLTTTPLLTLTGSGGCGKTRLGMQLAAEVAESFRDGVWMVELAALSEPALVVEAVANVLGVRERPGEPLVGSLEEWLLGRRLLLLLDNCEHVIGAAASVVEGILGRCPGVQVLATSREPLGIAGEVTWRVPSLSVLPPSESPSSGVETSDSVRLFIDRSGSAGGWVPGGDPAELTVVGEICRRLDGIPLAIELAAARTTVLSPRQISQRLDDRFRLLRGRQRAGLPRQQTLEATVEWSYGLLSEAERALLRRLSIFAGGWSLEGAEAVCSGEDIPAEAVLDLLSQLAAKSLVIVDQQAGETRYGMLETIRHYARRLLEGDPGLATTQRRHQKWYQALAADCQHRLAAGQGSAWGLLDLEQDNLRAALDWSLGQPDGSDEALALASNLGEFWDLSCTLAEGRQYLESALSRGTDAPALPRARALGALGVLVSHQGDYRVAAVHFEDALGLARAAGDLPAVATTLGNYGWMLWSEGRAEQARRHLEEGVDLARELDDPMLLARALYLLSHVETTEGSPQADIVANESLALARRLGEPSIEGRSLYFLGVTAMYRGDYEPAGQRLEESVRIARRLGDRWQLPWSMSFLGVIELLRGDFAAASAELEAALAIARETGNNWCVARCLGGLAWCRLMTGETTAALELAQQSLALSRQVGARIDTALAAAFLADHARAKGRPSDAERLHLEALEDNRAMRNPWGVAQGLERLARLALDRSDVERAAWLYGAAAAIRERHQCPLPPISRGDVESGTTLVERELGPASKAWRDGGAAFAHAGLGLQLPPPGPR